MDPALVKRSFALSILRDLPAAFSVFLLAGFAVGCGASQVPTAVTSPSPLVTPSVTAVPSVGAARVSSEHGTGTLGPYGGIAVPPGAYFVELSGFRYTFTVTASDWWTNNYNGTWLAIGKVYGENGPMTRLFIVGELPGCEMPKGAEGSGEFCPPGGVEVSADACHSSGTAFIPGATVDDLVAALAAVDGFESSEPSETTIGGYPGIHLRLTVPADVHMADCDGGQYHGIGAFWDIPPGQVQDVWVFDADGHRRVIWSAFDGNTPAEAQAELTQLINSLEIKPAP